MNSAIEAVSALAAISFVRNGRCANCSRFMAVLNILAPDRERPVELYRLDSVHT
jgi:hypothetical protein